MGKTAVLIPAFNAAKTIRSVIEKIDRNLVDEIIVVDDGSVDATAEALRHLPNIKVVSHPQNEGYGAATIKLYSTALQGDYDYLVNLHSDAGHDPADIPKLLEPLKNNEADIVFGSRTAGIIEKAKPLFGSKVLGGMVYGAMPLHIFIGSLVITWVQNKCYRTNYHCFHTGARACLKKTLLTLPFDQLDKWYLYDTEFLIAAHNAKARILEVPITTYYSENAGTSVPAIRYCLKCIFGSLCYLFNRIFYAGKHR